MIFMKKNIIFSITLFCFTSFIESCEHKKRSIATHALYSQTTYFHSCFAAITTTETVKVSDLLSKTAFVFTRSNQMPFERGGLMTHSYSIKKLAAIIYSDGSLDLFACTDQHKDKPVAKWPHFKGEQIELESTFK